MDLPEQKALWRHDLTAGDGAIDGLEEFLV
jgi:hypothetical protein